MFQVVQNKYPLNKVNLQLNLLYLIIIVWEEKVRISRYHGIPLEEFEEGRWGCNLKKGKKVQWGGWIWEELLCSGSCRVNWIRAEWSERGFSFRPSSASLADVNAWTWLLRTLLRCKGELFLCNWIKSYPASIWYSEN